ncbi:MAG: hypothetical protein CUN54_03070 [Phototrophicales bacterium]|nr:MAG: hypothetical protein CUN54_03070 [Phototrophicales bacterium]
MKSFFSAITRLSIKFRFITLLFVVAAIALGGIAVTDLQQELIPPIEFPQTIVLAQVPGMTSEQVLNVVTLRLEEELSQVEDVVNLESNTTGTFGAFLIARNDFGLNQERVREDIQAAVDRVWFPLRRIEPAENEAPQAFAQRLLADLTPEILIYLEQEEPNFLFELEPETWAALSDETVQTVLAFMASSSQETRNRSALRRLVEQEIVPEISKLEVIGNVTVSGGQTLPGEQDNAMFAAAQTESINLILRLDPEVWDVVSAKAGITQEQGNEAIATLQALSFSVPETAPALPESWQFDRFFDATDLLEMETVTKSIGDILNEFVEEGQIVGAYGTVDDLTPEIVTRMLEIEPGLVEYFEAEHLAAMSPEVFATLPADFVAGLDGFTRDELAAASLATSLVGQTNTPRRVELPAPWRIQPPQLISFSLEDLPLAQLSIFSTGEFIMEDNMLPANATSIIDENTEDVNAGNGATTEVSDIPEGPELPVIFSFIGGGFGLELDTADDLINIQLPEEASAQIGTTTLQAADFFNFLLLLGDPDALPPGAQAPPIEIDPAVLIGSVSADAIEFIAENDPTFIPNLNAEVYEAFSDDVLALDGISPPLDSVWDTLANQPQFDGIPLQRAEDILALGDGSASTPLNNINANIPERFAGYEVRLFNSITPGTVRYFSIHEPGFISNLDDDVLLKFSPETLASLPENTLQALDAETQATIQAIANGTQAPAIAALGTATSAIPPADPDAPALNPDWEFIGNFYGIELDSADDFFRFPEGFVFASPAALMNSLFDSAQGINFAPNLFGNLPLDAAAYMLNRDAAIFDDVVVNGLQLLPDEVATLLPADVQERRESGGVPFTPTDTITRTNNIPSLTLTIFKTQDANTVEAFDKVEEVLANINAENENVDVFVAFEQASFIEESISGVAREGGLGAIFAIIIILLFLSGGRWRNSPRRGIGIIVLTLFLSLLAVLIGIEMVDNNQTISEAFTQIDITVRILLILGAIGGFLILAWPTTLPYPAWRSTIVIGISIPLSILMSFIFMRWWVPFGHDLLEPLAENSGFFEFVIRLFPEQITLNIMTLSGLTVAIGRVVDDSIVVLENSFRQVQEGYEKREAIISATRDVSVAIFSATIVTMVVFLPLGLTGGVTGDFFLPFGLAVTYALAASYVVAITVVPALMYLFINENEAQAETNSLITRAYIPALSWSIKNWGTRITVIVLAIVSMFFGFFLMGQRPATFLPDFGEPQITITVDLPPGTKIIETNERVEAMEAYINDTLPEGVVTTLQTIVGGSSQNFQAQLVGGGSVSENAAEMVIGISTQEQLDLWLPQIREAAEGIFGATSVSVSGANTGFGGFAIEVSGPAEQLVELDPIIVAALSDVEGLINVRSNLSQAGGAASEGLETIIRIDGESATRYTAELETDDTLGVTQIAIETVQNLPELPEGITVGEGFESRQQTEGFQSLFVAMGIALLIVVVILIITFRSFTLWITIIGSIVVAPVGAAIALTVTDRVLGIPSMIGLLMLIGIVVTNAVVLIDRVQANRRERNMNIHDALLEAGERRLRPILMTALTAIIALIPLAVGLSEGAIIAAELGTVVIGGLVSSTILTLIVVPVGYNILSAFTGWFIGLFRSDKSKKQPPPPAWQEPDFEGIS